MKLELISPASEENARIPNLSLPLIASLNPPETEISFTDDLINPGHPRYPRELLQALIPLKKKWVGQASLAGLGNEKTIRLMAQSGCIGLLVGFESIVEENIASIGKFQNRPSHYMEVINSLHRNGIAIWASFIFGFDHDDPTVFERTVEFAIKAKIFSAVFAILTPYPGTGFYNRMKAEGRLTDERWWLNANQQDRAPHFEPMRMSRQQLREGWKWAWKEFYSPGSIIRRFQSEFPSTLVNRLIYFPFGLMQNRFMRKKILHGKRLYRGRFPSL